MWQTSIYYHVIRNKITPQRFSSLFLTDRELAHNPHGLYGTVRTVGIFCRLSKRFTRLPILR